MNITWPWYLFSLAGKGVIFRLGQTEELTKPRCDFQGALTTAVITVNCFGRGRGGRVVHHSRNVNYPTLNIFRLILSDSRHTHIQLYCQQGDPSTKTTVDIKKTFACPAACIENIRHFVSLVANGKGPLHMRGLHEPVCSRRAARCGTKKLSGPESVGLLCSVRTSNVRTIVPST